MNKNFVGVAGDWHGETGWALDVLNVYRDLDISTIYHLGDFGIWPGHEGDVFLRKLSNRLKKNNQTIKVTLGNHEDYVKVASWQPLTDGPDAGWLTHDSYPGIFLAPRGHRWEDGGRSFVSLGGANSIDRDSRTPGVSWWAEEQIGLGDAYRTVAGGHAEVFLAHEAPAGANLFPDRDPADLGGWSATAVAYANLSREMMRQVVDAVQPDLFFHGHYHKLLQHDTEFTADGGTYQFRGWSLDMNGYKGNVALLNLDTLEVEFPTVPFGEVSA